MRQWHFNLPGFLPRFTKHGLVSGRKRALSFTRHYIKIYQNMDWFLETDVEKNVY